MSESFLKPFEYMYVDTDRVIEQGTKIPAVNQIGATPTELIEQVPVEIQLPKPVIVQPVIVELPHEIPPQPPVEPTITSIPISSTPVEPQTSTTVTQKGRNIKVSVDDNVAATDK